MGEEPCETRMETLQGQTVLGLAKEPFGESVHSPRRLLKRWGIVRGTALANCTASATEEAFLQSLREVLSDQTVTVSYDGPVARDFIKTWRWCHKHADA